VSGLRRFPGSPGAACTVSSRRWVIMAYTAVTDLLREIRPVVPPPFELRFETPPGQQAQSLPPRKPAPDVIRGRGWTSRSSKPSSLTIPALFASSGCSHWCSGTAE
jgi:hypothetical protein